jgi:hypothetical protein
MLGLGIRDSGVAVGFRTLLDRGGWFGWGNDNTGDWIVALPIDFPPVKGKKFNLTDWRKEKRVCVCCISHRARRVREGFNR